MGCAHVEIKRWAWIHRKYDFIYIIQLCLPENFVFKAVGFMVHRSCPFGLIIIGFYSFWLNHPDLTIFAYFGQKMIRFEIFSLFCLKINNFDISFVYPKTISFSSSSNSMSFYMHIGRTTLYKSVCALTRPVWVVPRHILCVRSLLIYVSTPLSLDNLVGLIHQLGVP